MHTKKKNATAILGGLLLSLSLSQVLFAGGEIHPPADEYKEPTIQTVPVAPPSTKHKLKRIFTDRYADLMWQDEQYLDVERKIATGGKGMFSAFNTDNGSGKAGSLKHAKEYCATLNYAGFSDWRLPKARELMQVLDETKKTQSFYYKQEGYFWSSTPSENDSGTVGVWTEDAYEYDFAPSNLIFIRCVREMNEVDPQN